MTLLIYCKFSVVSVLNKKNALIIINNIEKYIYLKA